MCPFRYDIVISINLYSMIKIFFTFVLSALVIPLSMSQEVNDTVGKDLQEITVKADLQRITAQSATYYPTKRVKRAAQNVTDLLQRMAISQITVNPVTKEVTTPAQAKVDIFVNFMRASRADMEGLSTCDVKSVEYIDYPSDPRFQGARHVINITVAKYEYGGYTKISDYQETINRFYNTGSVYSRFSYRRMTYDLYAGPDGSCTTHWGASSNSVFHLAEGSVERKEEPASAKQRQFNIPVSLRVSFDSGKVQVANTVGFSFNDMIRNRTGGSLTFCPDISDEGYSYSTSAPSTGRTFSWDGACYLQLPRGWNLYIAPGFSYTHNNSLNRYSSNAGGSQSIINNAREDAYAIPWSVSSYKTFDGNHYLGMHVLGQSVINLIEYYGTSPHRSRFNTSTLSGAITYNFNSGDRFFANIYVGAGINLSEVNGITSSEWQPFADMTLSFSPGNKSQFQINMMTYSGTPATFMRSTNVIRSNELMFITGNPYIRDYQNITLTGSYTFFPCNEFNSQFFVRYDGAYNRIVNNYSLYQEGKYIVSSQMNSGDFNTLNIGTELTGRLFDNSLTLQATPSFQHVASSGYYSMARNFFNWGISAQYYFKNFNVSASYSSKLRVIGMTTGELTSTPSYYTLQAGWAKDAWNLSLGIKNIFRDEYYAQKVTLSTPYYENRVAFQLPSYHCALEFSATYTFGYGKKVNGGDEISGQRSVESAIMK